MLTIVISEKAQNSILRLYTKTETTEGGRAWSHGVTRGVQGVHVRTWCRNAPGFPLLRCLKFQGGPPAILRFPCDGERVPICARTVFRGLRSHHELGTYQSAAPTSPLRPDRVSTPPTAVWKRASVLGETYARCSAKIRACQPDYSSWGDRCGRNVTL